MDKTTIKEIIDEIANNGGTIEDVASRLGYSIGYVSRVPSTKQLEQLRWNKKRQKTEALNESVLTAILKNPGVTIKEISKIIGISQNRASKIVSDLVKEGRVSWNRECENCSNFIEYPTGTGRFCNIACARSYSSKHITEDGKKKRDAALKRANEPHNKRKAISTLMKSPKSPINKKFWDEVPKIPLDKESTNSKYAKEFYAKYPEVFKLTRREIQSLLTSYIMKETDTKSKISKSMKKHFSNLSPAEIEENRKKAKKAAAKRIKEGTHQGWKSRNIASYPEKSWKTALDSAGIEYKFNHPVSKPNKSGGTSNYFLDFLIVNDRGDRLDFEVDGKQHQYPEQKESDRKRDKYLKSLGYKILRTKWYGYKEEGLIKEEVERVEEEISKFIGYEIELKFNLKNGV